MVKKTAPLSEIDCNMAETRQGTITQPTGKITQPTGKDGKSRKKKGTQQKKTARDAGNDQLDEKSKSVKLQEQALELARLKQEIEELKQEKPQVAPDSKQKKRPIAPDSKKKKRPVAPDSDPSDEDSDPSDEDSEEEEEIPPPPPRKKRKALYESLPVSGDYKVGIETIVQNNLWKHCKFINGDLDWENACRLVMQDSEYFAKYTRGDDARKAHYLKQFMDKYGEVVTKKINSLRTDCQSNILKAFKKRAGDGKDMPTPAQLKHVLSRKGLEPPPEEPVDSFMPFLEEPPTQPVKPVKPVPPKDSQASDDETDEDPKKTHKEDMETYKEDMETYREAVKKWNLARKNHKEAHKTHEELRQAQWPGSQTKKLLQQEYELNMDFFCWYWTDLLPKATGKHRWGQGIRTTGTITGHAPPTENAEKYISVQDEALVLLIYENCGQRFPYVAECAGKREEVDVDDPKYTAKWSDSTMGQIKWGGWNKEGRKRFKDLCRFLAVRRTKSHVQGVEEVALARINKDKYGEGNEGGNKNGKSVLDLIGYDEELGGFMMNSDEEMAENGLDELEDADDNYLPLPPAKEKKYKQKQEQKKEEEKKKKNKGK